MDENRFDVMSSNNCCHGSDVGDSFKEAVCIDAARIYDSCGDKDCLADLRVYFTDRTQPIIDSAYTIKPKCVDVLNVFLDVEPVPFNKGFYSVDITYFFGVKLDAYTSPVNPPTVVCGLATASKKVILYGSEGSVKIFTNDQNCQESTGPKYLPKARVQVAEPMLLASELKECVDSHLDCCVSIPCAVANQFEGSFECVLPQRIVNVTIGLFSIVQLERQVQMMIPIYDFCIPEKGCTTTSDDPCDIFQKIQFPVDQFFPPRVDDLGNDSDCGCR